MSDHMGKKRCWSPEEGTISDGTPISVPKLEHTSSVQQAWNILVSHGMSPPQLNFLQSQVSKLQKQPAHECSRDVGNQKGSTLEPNAIIASKPLHDPYPIVMNENASSQTHGQSTTSHNSVAAGKNVVQEKEQRLIGLFKQLITEYGLDSTNIQSLDPIVPNAPIDHDQQYVTPEEPLYQTEQNQDYTANNVPGSLARTFEETSAVNEVSRSSSQEYMDENSSVTQLEDLAPSMVAEPAIASLVLGKTTAQSQLCSNCVQIHETQVAQLHQNIQNLQKQVLELRSLTDFVEEPPPRVGVLHRVSCDCGQEEHFGAIQSTRTSVFLDAPYRVTTDKRWHLQGKYIAPDKSVYLEQNMDVVLLVYKEYKCRDDAIRFRYHGRRENNIHVPLPEETPPSPCSEAMIINSTLLAEALTYASIDSQTPGRRKEVVLRTEIKAPYHSLYHDRVTLRTRLDHLDEDHRRVLKLLLDYTEESFEANYRNANILFSQGLVSFDTIHYLFEPEMNVVSQVGGEILVYRTKSWLEVKSDGMKQLEVGLLHCWSWSFDGLLRKQWRDFKLEWEESSREVKKIQSLQVYPLRYAPENLEQDLYARGEKFWSCRTRVYVSYDNQEMLDDTIQGGQRYMVDVVFYKQLNPTAFPSPDKEEKSLSVGDAAAFFKALPRAFYLLLPAVVYGFNMQTKRWVPIKVAHIAPVEWNTEAFDSLVINEDTKELVQALVTNQLAKEKGTDLMEGKGNGLVILLHGGPGTGKTLTAESVAELARKPLYRVTCGDIGTDVDAIDKHLQKVLHLGRLWDCVVLLDEADVFLEERSLADMQRNALVSVFLRVLEYYDGILILTSNRVGTFDEAFKSRIQLALHYENLSRTQRRAIWANFIKRLSSIESDNVNTDSLTEHLDELAAHDMNGRQIRNSLTTARQLALYKEKKMDYGLLKHAIKVASKFDCYLKGVKGNFSDDELAREGGVR